MAALAPSSSLRRVGQRSLLFCRAPGTADRPCMEVPGFEAGRAAIAGSRVVKASATERSERSAAAGRPVAARPRTCARPARRSDSVLGIYRYGCNVAQIISEDAFHAKSLSIRATACSRSPTSR